MTSRWKMKSDLVDYDRELRLTLALFGDDNLPSIRHVMRFDEHISNVELANKLRELADELEKGTL